MDDKEALRKAIAHYNGVVKEHNPKYGSCYAIPILEGLRRIENKLEQAESVLIRVDNLSNYLKGKRNSI